MSETSSRPARPDRLRHVGTVATFVVVMAVVWVVLQQGQRVRVVPVERSTPAPPLALREPGGRAVGLDEFRGRVVIVNLWASWCPPCRREIPVLRGLNEEFAGDGLVVLGVSVEQLDDAALAVIAGGLGIDYDVMNPAGPLGAWAADGGIPQTWLVDRAGRVRAEHTGQFGKGSMRRAVRRLLGEPQT